MKETKLEKNGMRGLKNLKDTIMYFFSILYFLHLFYYLLFKY